MINLYENYDAGFQTDVAYSHSLALAQSHTFLSSLFLLPPSISSTLSTPPVRFPSRPHFLLLRPTPIPTPLSRLRSHPLRAPAFNHTTTPSRFLPSYPPSPPPSVHALPPSSPTTLTYFHSLARLHSLLPAHTHCTTQVHAHSLSLLLPPPVSFSLDSIPTLIHLTNHH